MSDNSEDVAEALGEAMSGDEAMRSRSENRTAGMIMLGVLIALALVAGLFVLIGPSMLGPLGLVLTLLVFVVLLAFTAGK